MLDLIRMAGQAGFTLGHPQLVGLVTGQARAGTVFSLHLARLKIVALAAQGTAVMVEPSRVAGKAGGALGYPPLVSLVAGNAGAGLMFSIEV